MGLAVSGPLIKNNKLIITHVGGIGFSGYQVFWNGVRILEGFPVSYESWDGVLKARLDDINPDQIYNKARHSIGGSLGSGTVPTFLFLIAPDIAIYCLVGGTAMNAVITMRMVEGGMDGLCGNFNCEGADDSLESIKKRGLGASINGDDNLFKGAPALPPQYLQRQGPAEELASEVGAKYGFLGLRLPNFLQLPLAVQCVAGLCFFGVIVSGAVMHVARRRHSGPDFMRLVSVCKNDAFLAMPPASEYSSVVGTSVVARSMPAACLHPTVLQLCSSGH